MESNIRINKAQCVRFSIIDTKGDRVCIYSYQLPMFQSKPAIEASETYPTQCVELQCNIFYTSPPCVDSTSRKEGYIDGK